MTENNRNRTQQKEAEETGNRKQKTSSYRSGSPV